MPTQPNCSMPFRLRRLAQNWNHSSSHQFANKGVVERPTSSEGDSVAVGGTPSRHDDNGIEALVSVTKASKKKKTRTGQARGRKLGGSVAKQWCVFMVPRQIIGERGVVSSKGRTLYHSPLPSPLTVCEKMGTGSGHDGQNIEFSDGWLVPVPIFSHTLSTAPHLSEAQARHRRRRHRRPA